MLTSISTITMEGWKRRVAFLLSSALSTTALVFILSRSSYPERETDNHRLSASDGRPHLVKRFSGRVTGLGTMELIAHYDTLWRAAAVGSRTGKSEKTDVLGALLKKHVQKLRSVPGGQVELIFLVDSSASVGREHFFNEIKFIKKLLADFTVAQWATRVAIITFSSKHRVHTVVDQLRNPTNDSHKCSLLNEDLPTISYVGGGTYTKGAFKEAQEVLAHARPGAVKTLFLITDGYSNGGDPRPIAKELRENGVEIFTFGIRNGNIQELFNMSSDVLLEHCYILKNFSEFESLARRALHEGSLVRTCHSLTTGYSTRHCQPGLTGIQYEYLEEGEYVTEESTKCDSLCIAGISCCHEAALCQCGTHTGQYECVCPAGYYGTGVDGDCQPCPPGTFKAVSSPGGRITCVPCPDEHQLTQEGSTSVSDCYCPEGFRTKGVNGRCEVVRCPVLPPPENGQFFDDVCDNSRNKACAIMCDDGYKPVGDIIRLCTEAGEWTGTDFQCVEKTCDPFVAPVKGYSNCTESPYPSGTVCSTECNLGYNLVGTRHRQCLPMFNQWDGLTASCRPVMCRPMDPIINGYIQSVNCTQRSVPYGTTCRTKCYKGYSRIGSIKTRCGPDGDWTLQGNLRPQCTDVTPPSITCPSDITEDALPNRNYTSVSWDVPRATDSTGHPPNLKVTPSVAPPWNFPLGDTRVIYTAVDGAGLTAKCSFTVTVIDNEPPQVEICQSPGPVYNSLQPLVAVEWQLPVFSDNSGRLANITASHHPGEMMALGATNVEYIASDDYGNVRTCIIEITVKQHVCEPPTNPAFGYRTCEPYGLGGLNCTISCEPGYAFSVLTDTNYICHPDGTWTPRPAPKRDCQATYRKATHTMRLFYKLTNCSVQLVREAEQSLSSTLYNEITDYCGDSMSCNVSTVSTLCKSNGAIKFHLDSRADQYRGGNPHSDTQGQHGVELLSPSLSSGPTVEVVLEISASREGEDNRGGFLEDVERIPDLVQDEVNNGSSNLSKRVNGSQITVRPGATDFTCEKGSTKQVTGECVPCSKGTYFNVLSGNCVECAVGTYQPLAGMASCDLCPPGTSTKINGSETGTQCRDLCTPGSYSRSGIEQCESCPLGTFQPDYGTTECIPCPRNTFTEHTGSIGSDQCAAQCLPGTFSSNGLAPCLPCPVGTYQPSPQMNVCHSCPDDAMTTRDGSEFITSCYGNTSLLFVRSKTTLPADISFSVCLSNPCRNGGSCTDALAGFYCSCQPGYMGSLCEEDIDECAPSPCLNGTCIDLVDNFQCDCDDGFAGNLCEENIDHCLPKPCHHDGKCLDAVADFECECPTGYEGKQCDQDVDGCASSPCMNDGTCVDEVNGFSCICLSNFTGDLCSVEVKECIQNSTADPGACSNFLKDTSCAYIGDYAGSLCEGHFDYCESSPCHSNSTCLNGVSGFTCLCRSGLTGISCDTVLPAKFSLIWGRPTTNDYSILKERETFKDLYEVTVAFWMRTGDRLNYGTPFSYATSDYDNALTLTDYSGFVPNINNERVVTDVIADDGFWHHMALTWKAEGGIWDLYKDGVREANGTRLSAEKPVAGGGVFVLGQEQDEPGSEFHPVQNFIGEIAMLNLWSRYMSEDEIYTLSRSCENPRDAVISWPAFLAGRSGNITKRPLLFCEGCTRPMAPDEGTVANYRPRTPFVEVSFSCSIGFYVYGNDKLECQVSGEWLPHRYTECRRVLCSYPGDIEDGEVGGDGSFLFEDRVVYRCSDSYTLVGSEVRNCQANGQWTGKAPICIRSACGAPPELPNGYFDLEGVSPDHSMAYGCDDGYTLIGDAIIGCESFRRWQRAPSCERITCADPTDEPHLVLTFTNGSAVNDIRRYTCEDGYSPTDAEERICEGTGNWSLPVPSCSPNPCNKLPSIPYMEPFPEPTYHNDVIEIHCIEGYRMEGSNTVTCAADGSWDASSLSCELISCGEPPPVDNALRVNRSYPFGDNHTWTCRAGYVLTGSETSWCGRQGTWYPSPPTCDPVSCPSPPTIPNAVAATKGVYYRQQTTYTCDEGYNLKGSTTLECAATGYWILPGRAVEPDWPMCEPISCGPPPAVENARSLSVINTSYTAHFSYECVDGFRVVGHSSLACTADGIWQPSPPECHRISCGEPPAIGNAERLGQGILFGDVVTYSCIVGYLLQGDHSFVCSSNRSWTPSHGMAAPVCQSVSCGERPIIPHTVPDFRWYYFNENATVVCKDDYVLNGSSILSCGADGMWPPLLSRCTQISCGSPPDVANAEIVFNGTHLYETSYYTCEDGYETHGQRNVSCGRDGTWTPSAPICTPVSCGNPPLNTNLFYESSNLTYGGIARYYCERGYVLSGASTTECLASGRWSSAVPSCDPVSCGEPPMIPQGSVEVTNTHFQGSANYSCDVGYSIAGFNPIHCSPERHWSPSPPLCSPVSCGEVPDVRNARKQKGRYTYGETVQYQCDEGYEAVNDLTTTCGAAGQWFGVTPECSPISCASPPSANHATTIARSLTYDSVVSYKCLPGYHTISHGVVRCRSDGSWAGHVTECQPLDCGLPASIDHGRARFDNTTLGERVYYRCIAGYHMIGVRMRRCLADGWSDSLPSCEPNFCGEPPSESRLRVTGRSFHFNKTIEFSCDTGYQLSGKRLSTCQASGVWSSPTPRCVLIVCPLLTEPMNGFYNSTGETLGSLVTYGCSLGYELQGNLTRSCLENGTWSGQDVSCRPVECGIPPSLNNMTFDLSGQSLHHRTEFRCVSGFTQLMEITIECTEQGIWSKPLPGEICRLISCEDPPRLSNGYHYGTSSQFNSTVTFSCYEGYHLEGESTFICTESGWILFNQQSGPPICQENSCEPFPVLPNGYLQSNDTSVGGYAQLFCNDSFILRGDDTIICMGNSEWTAPDAECQPITCRAPFAHDHGIVRPLKVTYAFGDSVWSGCRDGYHFSGDEYRYCVGMDEWNGTTPQCAVASCGNPTSPNHGRVSFQSNIYGSQAEYFCYDGFTLSGMRLIQCLVNGTWSGSTPACQAVTCHPPRRIIHGTYHRGSFYANDTVQYYCEYGYRLVGNGTQRCASEGSWIGPTPSCVSVECPSLSSVTNGRVNQHGNAYLAVATFSCDVGYNLRGEYQITCLGSARWSDNSPSCIPRTCPNPPDFPGAYIRDISPDGSTFIFQTIVNYGCNVGYRPTSNGTIVCSAQGTWEPHSVECQLVECNTPTPLEGLTYTLSNGIAFSSAVTFRCDEGYTMGGSGLAVCTEHGTWDSPSPTCTRVECPAIQPPPYSRMGSEGNAFGDSIDFACSTGYHLVGEATLNCTSTGTWSASVPTCRRTVCNKPTDIENGVHLFEKLYEPDDVILYKCDSGYSLEGPKRRRCQKDGTWTDIEPTCHRVSAAALLAPIELNVSPVCVVPCLHGGICRGPYQCECRYGFTGQRCEIAVCMSRCSGGAKCIERNRECRTCKANGEC